MLRAWPCIFITSFLSKHYIFGARLVSHKTLGLMLYYPAYSLQYSHSMETFTYAFAFNKCNQKL